MRSAATRARLTAALVAAAVAGVAFASHPHFEGGLVAPAADGESEGCATPGGSPTVCTSWRVWHESLSSDQSSGAAGQGWVGAIAPGYWIGNVGSTLAAEWAVGHNHLVLLERERDGSAATHRCYYAAQDKFLTGNSPDYFDPVQLRPFPVPTAAPGGTAIALTWDAAVEDGTTLGRVGVDKIVGYHVYRSTTGTGGWTQVTGSMVAPRTNTAWTDTGVTPGQAYYYSLSLLVRGTPSPVESNCRGANSAPAAAGVSMTPTASATPPAATVTGTETASATASETQSATSTPSATWTTTLTQTATPSATVTTTRSATRTASGSGTRTSTASATITGSFSATASATATATATAAGAPVTSVQNPFRDTLTVWVAALATEPVEIEVWNLRGERVLAASRTAGTVRLDTRALARGAYIVSIRLRTAPPTRRVAVRLP